MNYKKDILFFRGLVPGVEKWGEIPKRIERPKGPAVCWPSHIGRVICLGRNGSRRFRDCVLPPRLR